MEKEKKQLSSRSDVLNVWVSKGGQLDTRLMRLNSITSDNTAMFVDGYGNYLSYSIYEILYSPESNFFEVMFPRNILARVNCVISKDPLQYLIENINETLSYQ